MSKAYVQTLLGVDNDRVDVIYTAVEQRLLNRLKRSIEDITAIPLELEYIVAEVTIARFNRIGSEGMSSESMDGHSANYTDDGFKPFESDINDFIDKNTDDDPSRIRGRVRFI